MYKLSLLLLSLLFTFSSCENFSDNPIKNSAGYFSLSHLKRPGGRSQDINETSKGFNLGDIHASREYFFILGNKGGTAITDITITSNHSGFDVSPENISILEPSSTNSDITPLIVVSVNHGLRLNGVGYTDLLPIGVNEATITVSGKTISDGAQIDVQSVFTFSVKAMVMAIEASDVNGTIDLTNPYGFAAGVNQAGGMNVASYYTSGGLITIKNIGNINMLVEGYTMYDVSPSISSTILPGESKEFQQPLSHEGNCGGDFCPLLFSIYGYGTISDPATLPLNDAGKGFLYL